MLRGNRHFLPDHVWHITHRCHQREGIAWFDPSVEVKLPPNNHMQWTVSDRINKVF
ncbi:MAG: hypothetical protein HY067_08530 [Betaproteobacteria bacterium]|nr:hypothetical protein [Betaproteobacteria bacterium]